jgi:hypothetical protein
VPDRNGAQSTARFRHIGVVSVVAPTLAKLEAELAAI